MIVITVFYLNRKEDPSGVSGTGIVADGVILPSGKAVVQFRGPVGSIEVFDNIADVLKVHGHDGLTEAVQIGAIEPDDDVAYAGATKYAETKYSTKYPCSKCGQLLLADLEDSGLFCRLGCEFVPPR